MPSTSSDSLNILSLALSLFIDKNGNGKLQKRITSSLYTHGFSRGFVRRWDPECAPNACRLKTAVSGAFKMNSFLSCVLKYSHVLEKFCFRVREAYLAGCWASRSGSSAERGFGRPCIRMFRACEAAEAQPF